MINILLGGISLLLIIAIIMIVIYLLVRLANHRKEKQLAKFTEKETKRQERAKHGAIKVNLASLPLEPASAPKAPQTKQAMLAEESSFKQQIAFDYAARAQEAYYEGIGLIEAYFFAQLAKLNGHRQIDMLISQIKIAWRRMGCPDEKEMMHDDFGELESAMGRACIRIDMRMEPELGIACLRELAENEVELARALLDARNL